MALQDKYSQLISYASRPLVENLKINEDNNVLYVSGRASSEVKDKLWEMYNRIDPDMRAADLVLNIETTDNGGSMGNNGMSGQTYEIKPGDSLSKIAQKYPNMTWQKIQDANKDTIKDPNKIYPGQKIKIPL